MIKWNSETQDFDTKVTHHESKELSDIVSARIKHIPKILGADWRDLPNISVRLRSGRTSNKLRYPYIDAKTGRPCVCSCMTKRKVRIFSVLT